MDPQSRRFMRRALALGYRAIGLASPNPPVGCVIVKEGKIVGEGWHEYAALDHAEVRALREAGELARNATAYLTLEPCVHYGRTPPCADSLITAGIRRLIVAHCDPNPKVAGEGVRRVRSAGVQVETGLFKREAARLIEPFARHVTSGRPLVVSKVGMSLDGRIGIAGSGNQPVSSPEGLAFGQHLRLQLDALLVGRGTIISDDPRLDYRGTQAKARPLIPVVLDSTLRTPPSARLFQNGVQRPVYIFCGEDAAADRRLLLEKAGAEVIPVTREEAGLNLRSVLEHLGRRGVLGLLVEGGSEVHWSFLKGELVDKFYFVVAPVIMGGKSAVPAVGGAGFAGVAQATRFRILQHFNAGRDLVIETYPSCSKSILSPWHGNR